MNKLLLEFMRENELDKDLIWKTAAERQEIFVRDEIGMHLTKSPIFVVSTHMSKSCLLPVYAFKLSNGIEFIMRENFHGWVVSIRSPFTIDKLPDFCTGDTLCSENPEGDIHKCYCEGFSESWVYKYKKENFNYSTFRVHDDYDLYTLVYILNKLEGKKVKDETTSQLIIKTCIEEIGKRHVSLDSIYDIFTHSYFAATSYDFCKKYEFSCYPDSSFEEGAEEFAKRLSEHEEIRLLFFNELNKIHWGENFS